MLAQAGEEYHDSYYDRPETSNSDLSRIKKELYGIVGPDATEAYKFGNLIDCMITEPHLLNYTNQTCSGVWFNDEEWNTALEMKKAFYNDEQCRLMRSMASGQAVSVVKDVPFEYRYWKFTLDCRCKWDLLFRELGWGADIKSTTATTQDQFEAACRHFDYDRQRAFYMKLIGSDQDMLIGISKVNYKIFKVPIRRGDDFHKSGERKIAPLALERWKLVG